MVNGNWYFLPDDDGNSRALLYACLLIASCLLNTFCAPIATFVASEENQSKGFLSLSFSLSRSLSQKEKLLEKGKVANILQKG